MSMDREIYFFDCELVFSCNCNLVEELSCMRADDVGAEYLAVFGVANDLDEAFRLAGRPCASVGGEGEPADFVVDLLFLALRFGQPNRRNFRMTVGRIRDVPVIQRMRMLACEELGEDDT